MKKPPSSRSLLFLLLCSLCGHSPPPSHRAEHARIASSLFPESPWPSWHLSSRAYCQRCPGSQPVSGPPFQLCIFIFKLVQSYKSGLIIYYSLNLTYLKLNSFNLSKEALLPDLYTLINPPPSQVQRAKTSGIPDSSHRQWV